MSRARFYIRAALVGVLAVAASACTAGKIVHWDGTNLSIPPNAYTAVTFFSVTKPQNYYRAAVTTNAPNQTGIATFSFDPYGPTGGDNNTASIPEDDYTVEFVEALGLGVAGWMSLKFHHRYDGNCNDDYTNKSVQCALYKLVLCGGYPENGQIPPCPLVSRDGVLTTLPLLYESPAALAQRHPELESR
jgi:hypothetical protein